MIISFIIRTSMFNDIILFLKLFTFYICKLLLIVSNHSNKSTHDVSSLSLKQFIIYTFLVYHNKFIFFIFYLKFFITKYEKSYKTKALLLHFIAIHNIYDSQMFSDFVNAINSSTLSVFSQVNSASVRPK